MDEAQQIQAIVNAMQGVADRLSMEGRFLDAAQVVAGQQALRAMWTRLHPPPVEAVPPPSNGASAEAT